MVTERGSQEDDQQGERQARQDDEVPAAAGSIPGNRAYPTAVKLPCAFTTIVPSPLRTPVHWN